MTATDRNRVPMVESFFEQPIRNTPYDHPGRHWKLGADGQPTDRILDRRRRLRVRFNDGAVGIVEMRDFTNSDAAGVFAALRDEALFRQVTVVVGAVSWPGELDIAPDAMHGEIKEPGTWIVE